MPKVRQDAWSHEDDLLLAETVLRHIREGSTQLKAFDEVGDILNRTSAACGFRWNAEVRQKYEQAVELAKKQRKEKKRKEASMQAAVEPSRVQTYHYQENHEEADDEIPVFKQPVKADTEPELQLSQVIRYLKGLQKDSAGTDSVKNKLQELETENSKLKEMNAKLNRQLEAMSEDYQALIQIMDRARKMVMFDDQDFTAKPHFKMEKNGNLEHMAR
ncbi:RsfA family transcriptional regulator [Halobacillus salinarum]|uniref:RsfA family transcriptional regulator n=1 Tax=Halobacillus salinarum TaxID=2932257 RepID=A0ABY4EP97_9BACI|nr:RsfA family transcriptional regulator [Halobacillus salinarum]UOQ46285.1 RsfA family transcriptional regulator [Halobacillus salinarum]